MYFVCILVAYGVYLGHFLRIRQDTSGYIRIHQDAQDTDVSTSDRVYLVGYYQDTSGYVRIRVSCEDTSGYVRIRQDTFLIENPTKSDRKPHRSRFHRR